MTFAYHSPAISTQTMVAAHSVATRSSDLADEVAAESVRGT
jgi:hypothetical protein